MEHAEEASRATNTSETENEELLIFFFSGHGIVNDQQEFVGLVPKDYNDQGQRDHVKSGGARCS